MSKKDAKEGVGKSKLSALEKLRSEYDDKRKLAVIERCKPFTLSDAQLNQVCGSMMRALKDGLRQSRRDRSSVKCYPTYVRTLPTGKERGNFLALDLGGTNFRVLHVEIGPDGQLKQDSKIYAVPASVMTGRGESLFSHLVDCIEHFAKERGLRGVPLGFTFSFPCRQEGLARGRLVRWTKGFACEGVEGRDVGGMLQEALDRRPGIDVEVKAVINDTTGTLVSKAWDRRNASVGVIVGTGFNVCYVEKASRVGGMEGEAGRTKEGRAEEGTMVVNTEMGAFGEKGELEGVRTEFDRVVDAASIHPGEHVLEKLVSGMYLGELVRVVLLGLREEGLVFEGRRCLQLREKGSVPTKYVSEIESDGPHHRVMAREILEEVGVSEPTVHDCATVRYVCRAVSRRAAHLAAAAVAAVARRVERSPVVAAVDGSLFRHHPHFARIMQEKTQQLLGPGTEVELCLSEDGSGRGAALVAASVR
ncbi:unnamed protein product [Darwinula stevensoni]|uniref:Phosphotransferase n=1 Tax=Darwinula stevensoni TaxID=69355 RepID=A0A7R9FP79_9CRUS|nr:unnamed protein product [Darwinula stevensoni]CAG0897266.1 unnamed protein product [Darwinula stevensoni]